MQEYKYTYQDWVDGRIEPFRYFGLLFGKEMSGENLERIATEQHRSFLYYIDTAFEALKSFFIDKYSDSLLKDEFLDEYISSYKLILETIKSEHGNIVTRAIDPVHDGRFELTKGEVDTYLSATVDGSQMEVFVFYFTTDIYDAGIEFEKEEKAPFKYILRSNFYNWLIWFKGQQESKNIEPSLKIDSDKLPKGIVNQIGKQLVSYTWLGKPDAELPVLYQRLIDKKLIHPDTTLEQFNAVFTAKPLKTIVPIKWDKGNGAKGLLAYFIDSIYPNKIHFNTDHWSVADKCFTNGGNLAQSKLNYSGNTNKKHRGKPKNYHAIDEVLKGL